MPLSHIVPTEDLNAYKSNFDRIFKNKQPVRLNPYGNTVTYELLKQYERSSSDREEGEGKES